MDDLLQWSAAVLGILGGGYSLFDAGRFQRHSAPWTRRVRTGIASLALGAGVPLGMAESAWAVPAVMVGMVAVFWPGDSRRIAPRDESAALRRDRE